SLRRSSIPVVQLYNESLPDRYKPPTDQQSHYVHADKRTYTLTLNSPTPGRVYLLATVLNQDEDVIEKLQWGEPLSGSYTMNVRAMYTLVPNVTSLDTDQVTTVSFTADGAVTRSFRVPSFTMSFELILADCQPTNCPVVMTLSDSLNADDASASSQNCSTQGQRCSLKVVSPRVDKESYVTFSSSGGSGANGTTFNVSFEMQGCKAESTKYVLHSTSDNVTSSEDFPPQLYRSAVGILPYLPTDDFPACVNQGLLGRVGVSSSSDFAFNAFFALWTTEGKVVRKLHVMVPDFTTEVRTFTLQDSVDSGGILSLQATLESKGWNGVVRVCAMPDRIAENSSLAECPDGAVLQLNSTSLSNTSAANDVVYLPFPVSGTWYLSVQSQCWGQSGPEPCLSLPMISLSVEMTQCAPDACGQYGSCKLFMEATTIFAACECYAGYRGLACNDTTYALTKGQQLQAVYLLTFSNLAFLPAIFLALYRHYFTLFYHACDASHVYQTCITHYDSLQFCDFFGSVLSFWALLMTMARVKEGARTFLLLAGAMVIAVFQDSERLDVGATVGPIAVAAAILVASWLVEMRRLRALFPSKRRYLFFLLPGAILAVSGIAVKFLVTSNASYQYGHSYWHFSVMLAPCFLMPPRRGYK
ncbi:hypothetical protein BaRGS_00004739, partial [Batillaria attramentaria]